MPPSAVPRRINAAGLEILCRFEECRLEAYPDPGNRPPKGDGTPWTIGWGSTGPDIVKGTKWSQEMCDARLQAHLRGVEAAVSAAVTVRVTDNMFSAMCSLAYNIGSGAFKKSTLVKKLNQGQYKDAADCFLAWSHSKGVLMPGLLRRRREERELFLRT